MKSSFYIWLVLVFLTTEASAETPSDALPATGSKIDLKPDPSGYIAEIKISPDAGFTEVKVKSTNSVLQTILDQTVDKDQQNRVKLLNVVVKTGALRQRDYSVTIVATAKDQVIERDVWLTVPGVTIEAPDTLVIVREQNWIGPADTAANQPQIWESTRHGWLTGITVAQKGNTDAGSEPAGRIVATATKVPDIAPGGNSLIELNKHYALDGNFPLGTAKGKLVIQADQLAEPVSFGFEVRSRMGRWLIFIPLIGGLGAGWFTRNWLQKRLELNRERQRAYALAEVITEALNTNKDGTFIQKATGSRNDAEGAARADKIDDVKSKTDAAKTSFQQALDDLQKRRTALDQEIARLRTLLSAKWRSSAGVTAQIEVFRSLLETGLPTLKSNDVDSATDEIARQRRELGHIIATAGNDWVTNLPFFEPALDSLLPLLGADDASLKPELKNVPDSLQTALGQLQDPSTEQLQGALEKLHQGILRLENLLRHAKTLIEKQVDRWVATLGEAKLPKPDLWQEWTAKVEEFTQKLPEASIAAEEKLRRLDSEAASLPSELKQVLLSQVTEAKDIQLLLNAGKYSEAIAKISDFNPPARSVAAFDMRQPLQPQTMARAVARMESFVPSAAPVPSVIYSFTAAPPSALPAVSVLAAITRHRVETTGAALSIIYGLIIIAASYFLFADKWVGTPLDFATVFFWAFATDLGADAATVAAKGLKKD